MIRESLKVVACTGTKEGESEGPGIRVRGIRVRCVSGFKGVRVVARKVTKEEEAGEG